MPKSKNYTEWIRLVATPYEKQLLEAIQEADGDMSFSNTVRRLIRQEANRRGIAVDGHNGHRPVISQEIAVERVDLSA